MKNISICGALAAVMMSACAQVPEQPSEQKVLEKVPVEQVWPATPVAFASEVAGDQQFICFYDADRVMTAAQRKLGSDQWIFQKLPSTLGWDSHNYIAMTLDDDGYIHVSGNMHVVPLVYFRSTKPYDVTSIVPVQRMTGEKEDRVTYPKFLRGACGELIFNYRDGSSGKGDQIYNVYDLKTRTWRRLLDRPLTDGEGKMNAYFQGPVLGADGYFHMTWVWRDTIHCETNHDLCHARSKDLVHWETMDGTPIELPIRLDTPGVIVDPVPIKQGMLNGNGKIGFDSQNRVVLAYHKFDENGKTQLYNARYENGAWKIYQTSDWNYRWYFSGGGSINNDIRITPVQLRDGKLTQGFSHKEEGSKTWVLNEETLQPVGAVELPSLPKEIRKLRSQFPGMQVRTQRDQTDSSLLLRWEVLPKHRDAPRPKPWPEPVMLEVYNLAE
ncbi:BNR repeat-containing protein [Tichowtungia aerotolerans]|uniref:BNR repeat-containing family member n=1 Tax=Tichowtungia aerotolerans TaxID=2697043 RepID=A0A6P1M7Y7_9BACT|nr:BNR repeat-containing protein [Tichowtungia aerotolerans]QHI68278.1 hypothetical protein GT409_02010 [Tichowtungia aerotolerans]